jgi:hypothetical protein
VHVRDEIEGGGNFLFSDVPNPASAALASFSYDFSKVVIPVTEEDRQNVIRWRKLAVDAFTD